MNTSAERPPSAWTRHLAVSLVCLVFLSPTLVRVWAAEGGTRRTLSDVKGRKGLKIDSTRVKYRGGHRLPAGITLHDGEVLVPTTNPRVIALVGYEAKSGACQLRLFSTTGEPRSEIHCESPLVAIPGDADLVWIAGKVRSEGFGEHGKQSPNAGLHLYDFRGQKLLTIAPEKTGSVGLLQGLNGGGVIFTSLSNSFRGVTKITSAGTTAWQLPLADPITNLRAFKDGEFFATQTIFIKERIRKAVLYGPNRTVIREQSGSPEDAPEFLAVTNDARHFVLATARGRRQSLGVFSFAEPKRPSHQLELDRRVGKLALNDNLRFMVLQVYGVGPQGESVDGFRIISIDGDTIAEQQCETAKREPVHIGKDQRSVFWSCDSDHVELEANGATP